MDAGARVVKYEAMARAFPFTRVLNSTLSGAAGRDVVMLDVLSVAPR